MNKGIGNIIGVIIAAIVLASGIGGYVYLKNKAPKVINEKEEIICKDIQDQRAKDFCLAVIVYKDHDKLNSVFCDNFDSDEAKQYCLKKINNIQPDYYYKKCVQDSDCILTNLTKNDYGECISKISASEKFYEFGGDVLYAIQLSNIFSDAYLDDDIQKGLQMVKIPDDVDSKDVFKDFCGYFPCGRIIPNLSASQLVNLAIYQSCKCENEKCAPDKFILWQEQKSGVPYTNYRDQNLTIFGEPYNPLYFY